MLLYVKSGICAVLGMDLIKFGPSSFMINIILDIQYIVQIVSKSNEEGLGLQAKENVVSMYFCMYTPTDVFLL